MKIPVANLRLCWADESVYVHLEISDPLLTRISRQWRSRASIHTVEIGGHLSKVICTQLVWPSQPHIWKPVQDFSAFQVFIFICVCVKKYSILAGNGTLSLFHRYIFWPHQSTSLVIESETLRPGLFISINIILIISTAHLKSQEGRKTKGQICKMLQS